jgi:hypothetical protein
MDHIIPGMVITSKQYLLYSWYFFFSTAKTCLGIEVPFLTLFGDFSAVKEAFAWVPTTSTNLFDVSIFSSYVRKTSKRKLFSFHAKNNYH